MFKIANNANGVRDHFYDYADKVKSAVSDYLDGKSAFFVAGYTGRFLTDISMSSTTIIGTGSTLEILLIGNFSQQKVLIQKIDSGLAKEETTKPGSIKEFYDVMKELFVTKFYENRFFFLKDTHIERIGIEVCPYCGRNYVYSVDHPTKSNPNTKVKTELDHFLPKSEYPYLAINYYNLVPSCKTCNDSPCKWNNDPIDNDRGHEYLMQPYEFRESDIQFSYIPTTRFYNDFSVCVDMVCSNRDLDKGYKDWLAMDKFYAKHNKVVTRMYVQLESIVADKYNGYLKNKFKVPASFLNEVPFMIFGYNLDDADAPFIPLHKFRKDIFKQIRKELEC